MQNEECWILFGKKNRWYWSAHYDKYSIGNPGNVDFDYDYVFNHRKNILGWIHTHPNWTASPSHRDVRTMGAWINCLGKPLVCCIKGIDGLRAHWFLSDESPAIENPVIRIRGKLYGLNPRGI